jgi:hypothetical protein
MKRLIRKMAEDVIVTIDAARTFSHCVICGEPLNENSYAHTKCYGNGMWKTADLIYDFMYEEASTKGSSLRKAHLATRFKSRFNK